MSSVIVPAPGWVQACRVAMRDLTRCPERHHARRLQHDLLRGTGGFSPVEQTAIRPAEPHPRAPAAEAPRIHTSCAVVVAPTFDRAFARWCLTVEWDSPRQWAAAFSDPATRTAATTPTSRSVARPAAGGRPARHALRTRSHGSGGSASRIVIGRSVVAGLSLSPRPNLPHRRAAAPRGLAYDRGDRDFASRPSVSRRNGLAC